VLRADRCSRACGLKRQSTILPDKSWKEAFSHF
jgi:hypothetical protein